MPIATDVTSWRAGYPTVDRSDDVLAYVRETLLRGDGHRVMTASNLPDAVILLSAMRPKVVVTRTMPQAAAGTRAADEFKRLSAGCAVVQPSRGLRRAGRPPTRLAA